MSLSEKLVELMKVTAQTIGDNDQRSALGIADSWVRGSNVDVEKGRYDESGLPLNRDGLAAVIIETLGDAEKDACKEALQAARAFINAPFASDPKIMKWRNERAARFPKGIGVE